MRLLVFVSIGWFLFAFALSVESAFGSLGENSTAHDLALGCLLAWFPILILASIVDRNPIAAEAIRTKLNALVNHVRHALDDKQHREAFLSTFQQQPDFPQLRERVDQLVKTVDDKHKFFSDFAGQARIRWHYGAAHPILCDIENCYIADKGRNWLADEAEARMKLVLGPINDDGLVWFDIREFWQVGSAIGIVGGSCGGAFVLSYFTPTVGLGCRSGGYTIFFTIALGLLIVEMTVWFILSPYRMECHWLQNNATITQLEDEVEDRWRVVNERVLSFSFRTEKLCTRLVVWVALLFPWNDKWATERTVKRALRNCFEAIRNMGPRRKWEVFFFRPVEIFNAIWLVCSQIPPLCYRVLLDTALILGLKANIYSKYACNSGQTMCAPDIC
jgi:hypothetical protein